MVRVALIFLGLSACSFGKNPGECVTDIECRDAFGLGSVCADDGFCDVLEPNIRCTETAPSDVFQRPAKYSDAIVIGSVFDMNNDLPQVRSAQLAVDQVNDLGGLDGRKVVMVSCGYQVDLAIDDLTEEEAALDITMYLADTLGAKSIIGPASSDGCMNVFPEMEARDVLVMSPSATSPVLTGIDGDDASDAKPGLFWRTVPPDDLQAQAMSWDLADRGVTNLVIVHQESSYATVLAEAAQSHFSLVGGTTTLFSFDNDSSRAGAIADAGASGAEEVMFLSSDINDIIAFLRAAALNSGINDAVPPMGIFLADAGADPLLLQNTDTEALYPRIRGTRPAVPAGPIFDQFQAAYASAYNGEDARSAVFAPYTYDATWLVLYGHAWSLSNEGDISGTGIARGLRKVSAIGGASLPVRPDTWPTIGEAFALGEAVNLDGASGALDFNAQTGETSGNVEIWVVTDDFEDFVGDFNCEPNGDCTPI